MKTANFILSIFATPMFLRNDLWCDSYGKSYKIRIGDYIFHYLIIVCEIGGNDIQRVKGI